MTTYQDSALDPSVLRRLLGRSPVDVVIGLPTYKNSRTIGNVITAMAEGMQRHFPNLQATFVVSDGGSTDDTIEIARSTALPAQLSSLIAPYLGVTGKGSAVRAILEVADRLDAKACVLVDADVRSISPDWVERLLGPILAGEADFVSPLYTRDRHEVTINDMIAYPLTRALYGRDVRQPLGGETAMTPLAWKTFLSRDVWETDVARFGIHIWMVTVAINAGWRLYQAPLGTKTHDYKDPTVGFEPKFMQIVGTMFRLMSVHRRVWPDIGRVMPVPVWGKQVPLDPEPVPTTRQTIWDGFRKGVKRYRRNLEGILDTDQRELLTQLLEGERPDYPSDAWARTVSDFAVVYNRGEGDPDKVALSLLPLYYARKATMLSELEGQPWTSVEEAIQAQAGFFLKSKPHLVERWVSYLPWQATL
jgi:hypothetical protein